MSSALEEPGPSGTIPRVVASSIDVYVSADALDTPGPTSYHERQGCYGAQDTVSWAVAIDHGAEPCGRCCESFEAGGGGA